jgi:hypothetical protein
MLFLMKLKNADRWGVTRTFGLVLSVLGNPVQEGEDLVGAYSFQLLFRELLTESG